MTTNQYAVLIERSRTGYGAYLPDLPGCVSLGKTEELVRRRIQEAVAFHLRSMREDGDVIPTPSTSLAYVGDPVPYAAIIERCGDSYSGSLPDLPGCGAVGATHAEVLQNLQIAVGLHLRSMRADGDPIPEPTTSVFAVSVLDSLPETYPKVRTQARRAGSHGNKAYPKVRTDSGVTG